MVVVPLVAPLVVPLVALLVVLPVVHALLVMHSMYLMGEVLLVPLARTCASDPPRRRDPPERLLRRHVAELAGGQGRGAPLLAPWSFLVAYTRETTGTPRGTPCGRWWQPRGIPCGPGGFRHPFALLEPDRSERGGLE